MASQSEFPFQGKTITSCRFEGCRSISAIKNHANCCQNELMLHCFFTQANSTTGLKKEREHDTVLSRSPTAERQNLIQFQNIVAAKRIFF